LQKKSHKEKHVDPGAHANASFTQLGFLLGRRIEANDPHGASPAHHRCESDRGSEEHKQEVLLPVAERRCK
jgi:hypothetical protein